MMLMVSWAEPASHKSITHYLVDYKTAASTAAGWMATPMNVTEMEYTIDGLINGTAYLVRVRAVDSAGAMGEWSDSGSGTPMAMEEPEEPMPTPALPSLRGLGARRGAGCCRAASPAPARVAGRPGAAADHPLDCASVESDAAGASPVAVGRRPLFLWAPSLSLLRAVPASARRGRQATGRGQTVKERTDDQQHAPKGTAAAGPTMEVAAKPAAPEPGGTEGNAMLRFTLVTGAWFVGLFGLMRLPWVERAVLTPFAEVQQRVADQLTGAPSDLVYADASCSGGDPLALCAGAIFAFPATWGERLRGAAVGFTLITAVNVVRRATCRSWRRTWRCSTCCTSTSGRRS